MFDPGESPSLDRLIGHVRAAWQDALADAVAEVTRFAPLFEPVRPSSVPGFRMDRIYVGYENQTWRVKADLGETLVNGKLSFNLYPKPGVRTDMLTELGRVVQLVRGEDPYTTQHPMLVWSDLFGLGFETRQHPYPTYPYALGDCGPEQQWNPDQAFERIETLRSTWDNRVRLLENKWFEHQQKAAAQRDRCPPVDTPWLPPSEEDQIDYLVPNGRARWAPISAGPENIIQ